MDPTHPLIGKGYQSLGRRTMLQARPAHPNTQKVIMANDSLKALRTSLMFGDFEGVTN